MKYFVNLINPQVTDTITSSSFLEQNKDFSSSKTSILSSDFHSKKMDSLVQAVTQKRRIKQEKKTKTIEIYSSILKVKQDTFCFLKETQIKPFSLYQFPVLNKKNTEKKKLELKKEIKHLVVTKISKKDTTITHKSIREELPQKHNFSTDYGIAIILLFSVFLMAYMRFRFRTRLKYYYKSFFNFSFFKKMIAERNVLVRTFSIYLSVIMLLSFSLLSLFSMYTYGNFSTYYLVSFSYLFLAFVAYFFILRLVHYFIGFVTETPIFIIEFDQNIFYYYRVLGILLLPIAVFIPYTNPIISSYLLFLAWALFFMMLVMRWLRAFIISFNHRVSFLYMILYLCALEILPLLVVLKLIEESY